MREERIAAAVAADQVVWVARGQRTKEVIKKDPYCPSGGSPGCLGLQEQDKGVARTGQPAVLLPLAVRRKIITQSLVVIAYFGLRSGLNTKCVISTSC